MSLELHSALEIEHFPLQQVTSAFRGGALTGYKHQATCTVIVHDMSVL